MDEGQKGKLNNEYRSHDIPLRLCKLLNPILMTALVAGAWYLYYAPRAKVQYYRKGNWVVLLIFFVLFVVFSRIYDAYQISTKSISEIIYSQLLSLLFSDAFMFVIIWLLSLDRPSAVPMICVFLLQAAVAATWAVIAVKWYFLSYSPLKTAVIYDIREGIEDVIGNYDLKKRFSVDKVFFIDECVEDISILDDFDALFLVGLPSHDRNTILKYCVRNNKKAYVIPKIGDLIMSGAYRQHMCYLPILFVHRYSPIPEYVALKRIFDIAVSLIGLIVLSPLMIVTAIAVKCDGGPAIYKQKRLTKDGKEFYILKFRSMRVDAEKDGVARLSAGESDDRITKVGRIIRALRFDELPQLLNVLSGNMSIVGPRPERPEIAAKYREVVPDFDLRLQVKAGLTGYAQVYGKYNTTPYDKLLMDLMYISKPSILEDFRICFATVKILFVKESTEGFDSCSTATFDIKRDAQ